MATSLVLAAGLEPITGYTLIRLLGRGGFGEVWEARAPGDFRVALKFLRLEMHEAETEQRALEIIRNIRHGHLLDVQFAARVADCLVIAMPLCDQSLMQRLRVRQAEGWAGVPRNELLRYMDELARAVDYLNEPRHQADDGSLVGVQHRDIKPDNIFLVGGTARLADFGLAKILSATVASTRGSMTPSYAAPEVIGGHFSRWSDQYSLAATYCELRTGRPPFVGENVLQVMYAHVNHPPELAGLPEEERNVVARALAKQPDERWPTCRAFVKALITAAREDDRRASTPAPDRAGSPSAGVTKLPETEDAPPIPPTRIDHGDSSRAPSEVRKDRPRPAGLAALVLLVVAILLAVVIFPRPGPSSLPPSGPAHPDPPSTAPPVTVEPAPHSIPDPAPIASTRPAAPEPAVPKPPAASEPEQEIITSPLTGLKLKLIPAGEFLMGSTKADDPDAQDDEAPRHSVRITRPFYLGQTEVTVGQFRRVVEAGGLRTEAETDGKGGYGWNEAKATYEQDPKYTWRNPGFAQSDDHPVLNISWNDAIVYCNKLSELEGLKPYYLDAGAQSRGDGYRLPTEAEWEYACRARTTTRYYSGNDPETLAEVGNIADETLKAKGAVFSGFTTIAARDGYVFTAPVGRFRPNGYGLYDMHGNVWEWCWDGYKADYYPESPAADPSGPSGAPARVVRGGCWFSDPRLARSADRYGSTPEGRGQRPGVAPGPCPSSVWAEMSEPGAESSVAGGSGAAGLEDGAEGGESSNGAPRSGAGGNLIIV